MKKSTAALFTAGAAGAAAAALWLHRENKNLQAEQFVYRSPKVTGELEGYRLLQVSDLHNARFGKDNCLLLALMEAQMPDCIAITGDLIDSYQVRPALAYDFAQKAARLAPCYFVTGNHEHRLEQEELKDFLSRLEQLGVTVLRNEAVTMGMGASSFRLLGVDCQQGRKDTVEKLMAGARPGQLQILLSHKPHYAENYARAGVDLVLCGHAHGGQFRLPVVGGLFAPGQGILPKYTAGMYRLGEQTTMLVSRGLGNSSFPLRVGNPPQLCVVTLRHGE